jgi:hypothetical protein
LEGGEKEEWEVQCEAVGVTSFYRGRRAVRGGCGRVVTVGVKRINAIDGREGLRRGFKKGDQGVGVKMLMGHLYAEAGRPGAARLAQAARGGRGWT